jgi:hypothetical protein
MDQDVFPRFNMLPNPVSSWIPTFHLLHKSIGLTLIYIPQIQSLHRYRSSRIPQSAPIAGSPSALELEDEERRQIPRPSSLWPQSNISTFIEVETIQTEHTEMPSSNAQPSSSRGGGKVLVPACQAKEAQSKSNGRLESKSLRRERGKDMMPELPLLEIAPQVERRTIDGGIKWRYTAQGTDGRTTGPRDWRLICSPNRLSHS